MGFYSQHLEIIPYSAIVGSLRHMEELVHLKSYYPSMCQNAKIFLECQMILQAQNHTDNCPPWWTFWNYSCYLFKVKSGEQTRNYDDSFAYCQTFGAAVHLVAIETEEEQQFLASNYDGDEGKIYI